MTEQQTAATASHPRDANDNALVERLEREARLSESIPEYVMAKHACLLKQAAERIKSLLAEVQRTRDYWYRQGKDDAFETYEADRQRMRDALEAIAAIWGRVVPQAEADAAFALVVDALTSKDANDAHP